MALHDWSQYTVRSSYSGDEDARRLRGVLSDLWEALQEIHDTTGSSVEGECADPDCRYDDLITEVYQIAGAALSGRPPETQEDDDGTE